VPVGAPVTVLLATARGAGRIKGQSAVELRVTSLRYRGQEVQVNTSAFEEQGKSRGKQSAIRTGLGAAAGALIGGLAGGVKVLPLELRQAEARARAYNSLPWRASEDPLGDSAHFQTGSAPHLDGEAR